MQRWAPTPVTIFNCSNLCDVLICCAFSCREGILALAAQIKWWRKIRKTRSFSWEFGEDLHGDRRSAGLCKTAMTFKDQYPPADWFIELGRLTERLERWQRGKAEMSEMPHFWTKNSKEQKVKYRSLFIEFLQKQHDKSNYSDFHRNSRSCLWRRRLWQMWEHKCLTSLQPDIKWSVPFLPW